MLGGSYATGQLIWNTEYKTYSTGSQTHLYGRLQSNWCMDQKSAQFLRILFTKNTPDDYDCWDNNNVNITRCNKKHHHHNSTHKAATLHFLNKHPRYFYINDFV